jgi:hypothetical protein
VFSPSPRPSRGEGWGEGQLSTNLKSEACGQSPSPARFASDLSPQAGEVTRDAPLGCAKLGPQVPSKQAFVVMGPRLRGDDQRVRGDDG